MYNNGDLVSETFPERDGVWAKGGSTDSPTQRRVDTIFSDLTQIIKAAPR